MIYSIRAFAISRAVGGTGGVADTFGMPYDIEHRRMRTSISGSKLILLKPLKAEHFTTPPHEYKWIQEAYEHFQNLLILDSNTLII